MATRGATCPGMQIALIALLLLSVFTALGVLFTELARVFESQKRPPLTRATISRLIREWAALVVFVATAPLAVLPSWPRKPLTTGVPQPPVLLIPGYGLHRMGLIPLAAYLRRRKNRWVWAVNNPSWRDDIPAFAASLERAVDRMLRVSGADQVDIIGHSMGGIVAAHYIKTGGGAGKVRRIVTLGTPWTGTKMHIFGIGKQSHAMAPGSPETQEASPVNVPVTALWTATDNIILPTANAIFEDAQAVELENLGHNSMVFSLLTMRAVEAALSGRGEE